MSRPDRVYAVIPAYNEESTVQCVVTSTLPHVDAVFVIDDGSSDNTAQNAALAGAQVISHVLNRGLGAALSTGFAAALEEGADAVVTLDADLQHDPSEIPRLISALSGGAHVVIGSRKASYATIPWYRRIAQMLGNIFTWALFGAWVSDSQSGFRAMTRHGLQTMQLKTSRMEVSSEIIAEARRHRLCLVEVPITAIYTEYSLSKGQSFFVGMKTLLRLIFHRIAS